MMCLVCAYAHACVHACVCVHGCGYVCACACGCTHGGTGVAICMYIAPKNFLRNFSYHTKRGLPKQDPLSTS